MPPPSSKKQRLSTSQPTPKKLPKIKIIVVEDHNHALEHIHSSIRAKTCPVTNLKMLHFDSHPDLAASPINDPDLCFNPKELYESLDLSASGIAEWILPLVYAKHVACVFWVKNRWSLQFGRTAFDRAMELFVCRVGGNGEGEGGVMRVGNNTVVDGESEELPYYVDDGSFIHNGQLNEDGVVVRHKVDFKLYVAELEDAMTKNGNEIDDSVILDAAKNVCSSFGWNLDICLDYFAVLNPFFEDLPNNVSAAMLDVSTKVLFRTFHSTEKESSSKESKPIETARLLFEKLLWKMLSVPLLCLRNEEYDSLCDLYENREIGDGFLSELVSSIRATNEPEKVAWALIDIIPVSMLPHGDNLEITDAFIDVEVQKVSTFLSSIFATKDYIIHPPGIVTIARSVDDGFTPKHIVESLQIKVLEMVERIVKVFFESDVEVVLDYKVNEERS